MIDNSTQITNPKVVIQPRINQEIFKINLALFIFFKYPIIVAAAARIEMTMNKP